MSQPISVVMPVYDRVTQLDFTGPHQFLSRTPDLDVWVASLGGRSITTDRLTFSNLEDLAAIESCDVLLVPGGGGCLAAIENDLFLKEIARLRALSDFGLLRISHLGGCRIPQRPPRGLPLGVAGIASDLRRNRRRWSHRTGRQHPVRGRRDGWHRFRAGPDRGAVRPASRGNGSAQPGIRAPTALQLGTPGHSAGRSIGGGERAHRPEPRSTTGAPRCLGRRPSCLSS